MCGRPEQVWPTRRSRVAVSRHRRRLTSWPFFLAGERPGGRKAMVPGGAIAIESSGDG